MLNVTIVDLIYTVMDSNGITANSAYMIAVLIVRHPNKSIDK